MGTDPLPQRVMEDHLTGSARQKALITLISLIALDLNGPLLLFFFSVVGPGRTDEFRQVALWWENN